MADWARGLNGKLSNPINCKWEVVGLPHPTWFSNFYPPKKPDQYVPCTQRCLVGQTTPPSTSLVTVHHRPPILAVQPIHFFLLTPWGHFHFSNPPPRKTNQSLLPPPGGRGWGVGRPLQSRGGTLIFGSAQNARSRISTRKTGQKYRFGHFLANKKFVWCKGLEEEPWGVQGAP